MPRESIPFLHLEQTPTSEEEQTSDKVFPSAIQAVDAAAVPALAMGNTSSASNLVIQSTPAAESAVTTTPDNLFQLRVRPIVRTSINQRDTPGESQRDEGFTGRSFDGIMMAIWERLSSHVKRQAVKTDGVWNVEPPSV